MRYRVIHAGLPIGESHLEGRDSTMGIAFGGLFPLPIHEAVRPVFRLFTEATAGEPPDEAQLAASYRARDALALSLVTDDGMTIPTEWIHIVDSAAWGVADALEVEVWIADASFFA